jgi:hypothetical protein
MTEVIWWILKGGAKEPLALFKFLGIEGVRGTHIGDHEVVKPEIPFWVKTVVALVGHEERRLTPCACSRRYNFWKAPVETCVC